MASARFAKSPLNGSSRAMSEGPSAPSRMFGGGNRAATWSGWRRRKRRQAAACWWLVKALLNASATFNQDVKPGFEADANSPCNVGIGNLERCRQAAPVCAEMSPPAASKRSMMASSAKAAARGSSASASARARKRSACCRWLSSTGSSAAASASIALLSPAASAIPKAMASTRKRCRGAKAAANGGLRNSSIISAIRAGSAGALRPLHRELADTPALARQELPAVALARGRRQRRAPLALPAGCQRRAAAASADEQPQRGRDGRADRAMPSAYTTAAWQWIWACKHGGWLGSQRCGQRPCRGRAVVCRRDAHRQPGRHHSAGHRRPQVRARRRLRRYQTLSAAVGACRRDPGTCSWRCTRTTRRALASGC